MRHYTFIDYATQGYIAVVGLIILLLHGDAVPAWPLLVLAHGACLILVHLLIEGYALRPSNRLLDFLRHFYPVLLYTGFYRETGELNQMLISGYLDPYFIRMDQLLFGMQPSLTFMEWLPFLAVSEVLYFAYFSYYLMITGVGLALFFKDRKQFFHYVSVVSFVFYACYLTYVFTPVMGPRILYREITDYRLPPDVLPAVIPSFPDNITGGVFYRIMAWIYHNFEAPGAAFPSSHVAIALCTVYFSYRYLRPLRHIHMMMAVLLCLSTVYCRYHYAVDVIAGVLTAVALVPLGNRLYLAYGRRKPAGVSGSACPILNQGAADPP